MDFQIILLIFLASALLFGYCFGFDLPQALQAPLRQQPFHYNNLEFNFLYFFQFLPVFLFQIPLGFLIDKYPIKFSLYFFSVLCFASMLVAGVTFEFMPSGYKWIINGMRSIFGISGQGLFTVQLIILTYCAKENYEMCAGICLCLPFVCDALNSIITTHVYDATKYMALAWYIAAGFGFISLLAAFTIDKKYIQKVNQIQKQQIASKRSIQSQTTIQCSQALLQTQQVNQQISLKSLKKLSSQFWVLCGAIFFYQAALGPYFDNFNDMIVKRFGIDYTDAGKMIILPQFLMVFLAYGFQAICSKTPRMRRKILLGASILYLIFISLIYLLPNTSEPTAIYYIVICIFLFLMSVMLASYYCGLFGSVSYFAPKQELGTAYCVATMSLGACQCLGPIVNSFILNQSNILQISYQYLSLFGAGMALFPVLFGLWIYQKQFEILDYNLKDDFMQKNMKQ